MVDFHTNKQILVKQSQAIVSKMFSTPMGTYLSNAIDHSPGQKPFYRNNLNYLLTTPSKSITNYIKDINLFFDGIEELFHDSPYNQLSAKYLKDKILKKINKLASNKNSLQDTFKAFESNLPIESPQISENEDFSTSSSQNQSSTSEDQSTNYLRQYFEISNKPNKSFNPISLSKEPLSNISRKTRSSNIRFYPVGTEFIPYVSDSSYLNVYYSTVFPTIETHQQQTQPPPVVQQQAPAEPQYPEYDNTEYNGNVTDLDYSYEFLNDEFLP